MLSEVRGQIAEEIAVPETQTIQQTGLQLTEEDREDVSTRSEESEEGTSLVSPPQCVASVSGMTQAETGTAEPKDEPSFEASSWLEPGPIVEHNLMPKSGNTTKDEPGELPIVSQVEYA